MFSWSAWTQSEELPKETSQSEFLQLLPNVDPIPILYLGSYHMSNPGADQFNLESDDVLAPKRQEELKEVAKLLARFKPTKIAVEAPYGDSATMARYHSYVRGELELRRSEEEQVGFRLAKMLGHEDIYPIDVKMGLENTELSKLIGEDPAKFGPYMGDLEKAGSKAMKIMGQWLNDGTIREMLYKMNDPQIENIALGVYFQSFVPIVQEHNYAGPDMVNTWYHRNIQIFSNLHQISDRPEDRILVVYGQGHIPLLKHFTQLSPYFEAKDTQEYLEK